VAGYCPRSIPHYTDLAAPLTSLLCQQVPFVWGKEQQAAFDGIVLAIIVALA
jgi:hypothetical protein